MGALLVLSFELARADQLEPGSMLPNQLVNPRGEGLAGLDGIAQPRELDGTNRPLYLSRSDVISTDDEEKSIIDARVPSRPLGPIRSVPRPPVGPQASEIVCEGSIGGDDEPASMVEM